MLMNCIASHAGRSIRVHGQKTWRLPSSSPLHLTFRPQLLSRGIREGVVQRWALCFSRERPVQAFYRLLHVKHRVHLFSRWKAMIGAPLVLLWTSQFFGKFAPCVIIRVLQSCSGIAEHCVIGWLGAKIEQQNGTSSIDVAGGWGGNDCGVHCRWWCHIGIGVGDDGENKVFLQEDLIDDNVSDLILLELTPTGLCSHVGYPCCNYFRVYQRCVNQFATSLTKSHAAPNRGLLSS